jgi:single-strand DNA-binding protein
MARSENMAVLIGNLGRDAETTFTPSGIACTKFSIATTRRVKRNEEWKDETTWHNIVLWRSENLANYLLKGTQVYVKGWINNRSYEKDGEKKYISEVVADVVNLLGGNKGERQGDGNGGGGGHESQASGGAAYDDDSVPF